MLNFIKAIAIAVAIAMPSLVVAQDITRPPTKYECEQLHIIARTLPAAILILTSGGTKSDVVWNVSPMMVKNSTVNPDLIYNMATDAIADRKNTFPDQMESLASDYAKTAKGVMQKHGCPVQ